MLKIEKRKSFIATGFVKSETSKSKSFHLDGKVSFFLFELQLKQIRI